VTLLNKNFHLKVVKKLMFIVIDYNTRDICLFLTTIVWFSFILFLCKMWIFLFVFGSIDHVYLLQLIHLDVIGFKIKDAYSVMIILYYQVKI
jgi:hypothetical protein